MLRTFLFFLITFASLFSYANPSLRGLRVDPSYFYKLYPDLSAAQIASKVIGRAQEAHVNTLFVYAYNSVHGSFYPTQYPLTEIETHFGEKDIFSELYRQALAQGMRVVAAVSLNDFKSVWDAKPEWRAKLITGADYQPRPQTYFLSVWHPEYRVWLRGFIEDLATKFPQLYAIEAIEPTIDCYWRNESDFNPEANKTYFAKFPAGTLGDSNWKLIRAEGLTDLIAMLSEISHSHRIKSGVVQTWPVFASGPLFTSDQMRDVVGFDLNGILTQPENQKIDFVVGELLWQQWLAEYGNPIFTPDWTLPAAKTFSGIVNNRTDVIIHIEISPWYGQHSTVIPNLMQFQESLSVIAQVVPHIDVYDFSQIENRGAWDELSVWK